VRSLKGTQSLDGLGVIASAEGFERCAQCGDVGVRTSAPHDQRSRRQLERRLLQIEREGRYILPGRCHRRARRCRHDRFVTVELREPPPAKRDRHHRRSSQRPPPASRSSAASQPGANPFRFFRGRLGALRRCLRVRQRSTHPAILHVRENPPTQRLWQGSLHRG